jgi:hypothetical protein
MCGRHMFLDFIAGGIVVLWFKWEIKSEIKALKFGRSFQGTMSQVNKLKVLLSIGTTFQMYKVT